MAEGGSLNIVGCRSSLLKIPTQQRQCYKRPIGASEVIPESWLCAYCHGLLILAFQTDCGCRFCEVCLIELSESEVKLQCPGGVASICGPFARNSGNLNLEPKPDKAVDRLINQVVIVCPNKCTIKNLQAVHLFTHLQEACPKRFCSQCEKVTERGNFERDHNKMVECKDCKSVISQCLFESHREDPMSANFCKKFSGLCPYCKIEEIKTNELQLHRLFCEKWQQKCKYEALGCNGDHENDIEEELVIHLPYILRNISETSSQLSASEKEENRKQSLKILKQCSDTVKDLEHYEKIIKEDSEFMLRLTKAEEEVTSQCNLVEQFHQQFKRATNLSLQSQQPTPFPVAPYIWRIPNYLELKKHESVLDSRPFVSNHYGYKMRVRLYLNGDGQGRGTHLSAYVILMAHDYDNLRVWPFQLPFLFTLLDQTQKGQDYQQLIHPNPKSRSFQRPPRTEADSVRASGCAKFFPLERLLPHCIYLQDGTLYIKIDILNASDT